MPARRRLAHEEAHDVVGIVRVADAVGAAQKHLQEEVRRALADRGEPLPRVLGQEAHGDVEGRAAPAFEREKLRQRRRIGFRHRHDVVAAHARRKQRLVGVAHRRVGDEHAPLVAHPAGEIFRPVAVEALLRALRRMAGGRRG